MNFTVCAKFGTAVQGGIQAVAFEEFVGTPLLGYSILSWKVVQPHHHKVQELNQYPIGEVAVWVGVDNGMSTFFDNSNFALNFSNVFVCSCGVNYNVG